MRNKKNEKIGIFIFLSIVIISSFIIFISNRNAIESSIMLSTPRIEQQILTNDGEIKAFGATLTLELSPGSNYNNLDLELVFRSALNSMSFDELVSENGMFILRQNIRERAVQNINGEVLGVFLTNVLDTHSIPDATIATEDSDLDIFFEAIFGQ